MRTTIYFLTEALGCDDADNRVANYLESERFFDYLNVLPEESGPLELKRNTVTEYAATWDWKAIAKDKLKQAQKWKRKGDMSLYGYNLCKAGELYEQTLNENCAVYNIETGDYTIPDTDKGWFAIAVDFHF